MVEQRKTLPVKRIRMPWPSRITDEDREWYRENVLKHHNGVKRQNKLDGGKGKAKRARHKSVRQQNQSLIRGLEQAKRGEFVEGPEDLT
jgi:hypothetical protein